MRNGTLRVWLKGNMVYIQAGTALLLSLAALSVMYRVNQVAGVRITAVKAEHLPALHFRVNTPLDPAEKRYVNDELIIYNSGSPVKDFASDIMVFIKVDHGKTGGRTRSILLPLAGYYDTVIPTNNDRGELARVYNGGVEEGNNWKVCNIVGDFCRLIQGTKEYGIPEIVRYVRVSYRDVFNKTHDELYQVDVCGTKKLSGPERDGIMEDYENKCRYNFLIDLKGITSKTVYEKCMMAARMQP